MPIQLIVASSEPRFHDFVREQLASTPNAEVVGRTRTWGRTSPCASCTIVNLNPQAAVLLDISCDPEQGLRALEQMRQSAPDLYVILSDLQCSQEFLLRSMRLGSADFLQQPLKRAEFSEAMTRLEQHSQRVHRQDRQLGRMYTFVGVKGGMGTTTAAINFAALCAKQNKSTVLVDLDMDSGDAACYLGLAASVLAGGRGRKPGSAGPGDARGHHGARCAGVLGIVRARGGRKIAADRGTASARDRQLPDRALRRRSWWTARARWTDCC